MKNILIVGALSLAACGGRTGGVEIGVSKKNGEWHVDVAVSAPLAKRTNLLQEVIKSGALHLFGRRAGDGGRP